jgi:hypothetical protein
MSLSTVIVAINAQLLNRARTLVASTSASGKQPEAPVAIAGATT